MIDVDDHIAMENLRVSECLVETIDTPAGDVSRMKAGQPGIAVCTDEDFRNLRLEQFSIRRPLFGIREPRIHNPVLLADRSTEFEPRYLIDNSDHNVDSISTAKCTVGGTVASRSLRSRDVAVQEIVRGEVGHHSDLAIEQRDGQARGCQQPTGSPLEC